MNVKQLLVNREWQISGNWHQPEHKFDDFKSVRHSELWNTTSSAGDWTGFIIQKIKSRCYLIPFYQSNNYPRGGYTLTTGDLMASWINGEDDNVNIAYQFMVDAEALQ